MFRFLTRFTRAYIRWSDSTVKHDVQRLSRLYKYR